MEATLEFPSIDMQSTEPLFERPALPSRMIEQTAIARGIESVAGAVGEFDRIAAGLAAIETSHPKDVVCDVRSPTGMRQAVAGRAAWRDPRVAVERARKAAKAPVLALGRDIDTFAARLESTLRIGESNYDEQIKVREAEIAAEKAERERIEAERVAKHQAGIARIRGYMNQAVGKSSTQIVVGIAVVERMKFGDEWQDFAASAASARDEVLNSLREYLLLVKNREDEAAAAEAQRIEQARIAEEQRVERERLAAETAELTKMHAEIVRQREKWEADQLEARNLEELRLQAIEREDQAQADRLRALSWPIKPEPAPVSAPAAPAVPVPVEIISAPVDARPPINLTQISDRLGFKVTRALLEEALGIPPSHTVKASVYWPSASFGPICAALVKYIQAVAA